MTILSPRETTGYHPIPLQESSDPLILFSEWFGNEHPVELEIGCGKGKFLIARAKENPNINFIGLDWAKKWLGVGEDRSKKQALSNLRFLWVRASEFLKRIPAASLSVVHIYFPDPWPKRRHHVRRLIQPALLEQLHGLLRKGGLIEIATDDEEYFKTIRKAIEKCSVSWGRIHAQTNQRIFCSHLATTYELKYAKKGKPLYYLELEKS